jgi:rubrerythrin
MNEFEMIKKADVMRIINAENAVVLNNMKERSTDEVLCAIAAQINGLQTTEKSGSHLIDANAFSEQYGNYYAEEGPEDGFIGTVGDLIAKQPTIEAEPVRHGRWKCIDEYEEFGEEMADYLCESCGYVISRLKNQKPKFCEGCGARMDGGADNDSTRTD